jgi:hypothetical protein
MKSGGTKNSNDTSASDASAPTTAPTANTAGGEDSKSGGTEDSKEKASVETETVETETKEKLVLVCTEEPKASVETETKAPRGAAANANEPEYLTDTDEPVDLTDTEHPKASVEAKTNKEPVLVYPFQTSLQNMEWAALCLKELAENPPSEQALTAVPSGLNCVTLYKEDYLRLAPGKEFNDNLVDFYMLW